MAGTGYRARLYESYSQTFGAQKEENHAVQWEQYDAVYGLLPVDHSISIVDLGCGKGEWVHWLVSKGFRRVLGVDGSQGDLNIARARGPGQFVHANALEHLRGMPDASVDLIHLKDVVEHLTRDELLDVLDHARRTLRPGGRLWMLTFNAQSPLASATRYGDLTHELGLTPSSAAQALRAAGFAEVAVAGYHYCPTTIRGLTRRALGLLLFGVARIALRVRHGDGARASSVDALSVLPDIFATASK